MTVKIDMDMPRCCTICPFKKVFFDSETWNTVYKCGLALKKIDIRKRKRPDFCPLKECKQEDL